MEPNQFLRLKNLFNTYAELPPGQRQARIDADPELDDALRQQLRVLFEADDATSHMTARSALGVGVAVAVAHSATHWIGRRVGAFVIERELGSGGMGVVYHAARADGEVTQDAAIKVLRSSVLDVAARERFQRERELLARLSHPHIARLFDAGVTADGQPYFVMEHVRGATLTRYCDEQRLSIAARLRLFLKVCDAVRYAHSQLVLHRDIKPSNVLIDEHGAPRLIDFGIAKPLRLDAGMAATITHQRFFSPLNAAPEQLDGDAVGVACDVYQLGTLLYELLCGKPIFDLDGKTPGAIEAAIRHQLPASPSARIDALDLAIAQARHCSDARALQRQLRGDLDAITLCALRKEQALRYSSVEQLADDITRHLEQRPVQGRRGTARYRASLYFRRNWRALTLSAVALLSACAFVVIVVRERDKAVLERGRAEAATQFLFDMFAVSDGNGTGGPNTPVSQALRRGAAMVDENRSLDNETRLKLLTAIGRINVSLSDLAAAAAVDDKAVALARSSAIDRSTFAEMLLDASSVHYMRGEPGIYGPLAVEAAAIFDTLGMSRAKAWRAHIMVLRWQRLGDHTTACLGIEQLLIDVQKDKTQLLGLESVLREAIRCRENFPGTLAQTERQVREAIATLTPQLGANSGSVQRLQVRYTRLLRQLHRYDEAVAVLEPILKAQTKQFGEQSWSTAYTQTELGAIALERRRYDEAEPYLLRAHEQYTRMYEGGANTDYSQSAFALARLYDLSGKDPDKALTFYETALKTVASDYGQGPRETARISAAYGALLKRKGDAVHAEERLRAALTNLPSASIEGLQARLDLAELLQDRGERNEARTLVEEAGAGVTSQNDPGIVGQLERLKARLNNPAR